MLQNFRFSNFTAILISLLTANSVVAQESRAFDGGYLALGLGLDRQKGKTNFAAIDENQPFSGASKSNSTGLSGGAIVGYGQQASWLGYLGAEIDVGAMRSRRFQTGIVQPLTGSVASATTSAAGLAISPMLRLGFVANPDLLIFARLGFSASKIRHANSGIEGIEPNESYTSNISRRSVIAPKFGIGAELRMASLAGSSDALAEGLFLRADVSVAGKSKAIFATTSPATGDADFKLTTSQRATADWEFRLSLGWRR